MLAPKKKKMETKVKINISGFVTLLIIVLYWLFAVKGLWLSNHFKVTLAEGTKAVSALCASALDCRLSFECGSHRIYTKL